jgi:hypothetical protein
MGRSKIYVDEGFKKKREEDMRNISSKRLLCDWQTVCKMTGLKWDTVIKSWNRIGSKHHNRVFDALSTIVKSRENMIAESPLKYEALVREEY